MKPEQVILYIKPWCGWCTEAKEWLDARRIRYTVKDVTSNRDAWDEMVQISGQSRAPVIQVDGEVLADFDVDQLGEFWTRFSPKSASRS